MGRLQDQNIIVTGGSRGIGAGIVKRLAEEGARVAFTYSSRPDSAEKVLSELPGEGHFIVQLNQASSENVKEAFKKMLETFDNKVDGLVNNAGITKDQLLLRMKDEDFNEVIQTNLTGAYLCAKEVLKPMMKARKGSIVSLTSVIGQTGNAGQANYAASKAGVMAFTKSLAQEMGARGLRANCIAPGFIVTDMTDQLSEDQKKAIMDKVPLAKLGQVDDIANACLFLLSDESSYITGHTLSVNGGLYM